MNRSGTLQIFGQKVRTSSMSERSPLLRRLSRLALVGTGTLALSSCALTAEDAPQDTWDPAGDNAQKIHDLQWPIFAIAGVVGVIVTVVVILAVVKFRDRGQPIPEQSHGNPIIEYTFIALPAALLAVIAGFTVNTVLDLNETADTECVINVTGQQWWWEYDYPVAADGSICGYTPTSGSSLPIVTSGQVIIPTGTNVLVLLLDPAPERQARHGPGPRAHVALRGRPAGDLRRPVHRVLRSEPRQHAHGDGGARPRRLPAVARQPARAVPGARGGHAGRRG
jgi:Cytochrome C oxidase subunit II, transmembrane domain